MWFNNFGENLSEIRSGKSIWTLPKIIKPALIIGGGPSIGDPAKTFKILKDSGKVDELRIFCSDRMLKPLLEAGIEADIVGSLDGDPVIANFYDWCSSKEKTVACFATQVHPDVVKTCPYPKYWFNIMYDDPYAKGISLTRAMHWMSNKKMVTNGYGNIGGWLAGAANDLEATPIILVGIDMSYGLETAPMRTTYWEHFLEQYEGNKKLVLKECYQYITNYWGKRVLTDLYFNSYRDTLETGIENMKSTVWNCSEYSIVSGKRVKHMTFEDALAKL